MLLENHSFEFDDFLLNTKEKVLLRNGKPLSITPKAFQLLLTLVKNHGHLVAKDELMKTVWTDSFVEDGNLTFTIRLLRKALGDSAQNPRFIETVTKHGYRFISDVRRVEPPERAAPENVGEASSINQPTSLKYQLNIERGDDFAADRRSETEISFDKQINAEDISHSVMPAPRPLFGRESEITAVENLLRREDVRLVTLTGVGGSGKTSLARAVAGGCSADFPDGIFFVELAPVSNPELVTGIIAQALDVKAAGGNSLLETLQTFLRGRRILLILDNFERIIAAANSLAELISVTCRLKILVTSRAALRLNIENELIVPPLTVPPTAERFLFSVADLENYSSVQMFVERARTVKPKFALTAENASDISEICVRLDGLPLAIELAAARIKLLAPSAILQRLENRLQILTSRSNDLPARQQTIRNTITWSFELLGEEERLLFKRLAVFAGGFTIEAAETICGAEKADGAKILDELESLVTNNLLRQTEENGGKSRLLMLETIREYAAERLMENAAEETELRHRHAGFFLNYAREIERDLMGARQAELLNQLEADRDNFRAAVNWYGKTADENELKLAAALTSLWTFRGYLNEGVECLSEALRRNPNAAPAVRAKALALYGQLIWVGGDYVRAIEICEKSLALARRINYPIMSALSLFVLGMARWYRYGDAEKSTAYLKESLDLYREIGFDSGIVFASVVIAAIYQSNDNLPQAARMLDESLSAADRTGNNLARSIALVNYGRLKFAEGDYEQAKQLCRKSLRLREELSDKWGLVQCLEPLTAISVIENNPQRAAKMLGAIDVLLELLGAQPQLIFRADHESSVTAVRAALDDETFARLFAEGRKLSANEIVNLALDDSLDLHRNSEFDEPVVSSSISDTPTAVVDDFRPPSAPPVTNSELNPPAQKAVWLAAILLFGVTAFGWWYLRSGNIKTDAPVLSAAFNSEKLSANGKVNYAVVSPDGKNVFYTNQAGSKMSIWLRQLESGNNVEIIPPSDNVYAGLALSPDGNFLYFARRPRGFDGQFDIYRVSIFGGVPVKIVSETQGWISISPNGEKVSFVRCYYRDDEFCSLWIADAADGKNEKMLSARPRPFRIGDNKFSPDGKSIAFAVGQSENQANDFGLATVDIEIGRERELIAEKFFNIKSLAWLPGEHGLLLTASRIPNKNFRIWQVTPATGEAQPLTNDTETYSALSLSKNAAILVATKSKQDFRLRLFDMNNPSVNRLLTDASTASFAPNGKIVFSSVMSGNDEIWSIEPDGSGQRQLTNDPGDDSKPIVSPDSNSIFFASNQTGEVHVWRMNADGSNQTQITRTDGGFPVFVTPDGNRVYYQHGLNRTLWRVSRNGGDEQEVFDKARYRFAVSPDGSQVAFSEKQGDEKQIVIFSLAGGEIVKTIKYPDPQARMPELTWLADGKHLAYILSDRESENNTLWIQPLNGEKPLQIANLGDETISETTGLAVSPDGKSFIVVQGGWLHDAVLIKGLR